uniref:Uncharacterized protein n=1 Tax=Strongyloides papillosus TaxID=174720 RepID=A0A0N5CFK6_STREA
MSGFYRLLILLFIFIYKTNEVRLPQYEYLTAITGKLTCKYPVGKGAVVTLYTKSVRKSRRKVLSSKYVEYGNAFFISGSIRSFLIPRKGVMITLLTKVGKKQKERPITTKFVEYGYPYFISGAFKSIFKPRDIETASLPGKDTPYVIKQTKL